MFETRGNLWTTDADVRVITTNGYVKKDGSCVMGRGCALEAKSRFPGIEYRLGTLIAEHGNHAFILSGNLVTMPVKHNWWEEADPGLIVRSAKELVVYADQNGWNRVLLPRPGCGNGKLSWADVKPLLDPIFDNRFCVITF